MTNNYITLSLPQHYYYVLALACLISFHCFIQGFAAGYNRRSIFNDDFMKKNFEKDHLKYLKANLPKQGYPDCGNGVYS